VPDHPRGQLVAIGAAAVLTLPGVAVRLSGGHPAEVLAAVIFGAAVVGAAFLMAWGAEVLQLDLSQGLSLAVLALIAVLPEYAVDFTFAWKAGADPDTYASLALANMTGGNRLLIGIGWSLVVLLAAWRVRRIARERGYSGPVDTDVALDRSHSVEIAFLALATVFSFTLPLQSTLPLWSGAILVTIFVLYMVRISRAPAEEPHLVGPARLVGALPPRRRRVAVGCMLVGAAGVILLVAEPFAEALVETGENFGVSTFLLVQWVAPLASETPELLVAALFAWRLNTGAGLGTLVSSKVNQWTLLVGTLPFVFAISAGGLHGLPIDSVQREELFLTAAQSAFAVAILANRAIDVREATLLLVLFLGQFVLGGVVPESVHGIERVVVASLYLLLAGWIVLRQRRALPRLFRDGFFTPVHDMIHDPSDRRPESVVP